jgi:hypothetical protein
MVVKLGIGIAAVITEEAVIVVATRWYRWVALLQRRS